MIPEQTQVLLKFDICDKSIDGDTSIVQSEKLNANNIWCKLPLGRLLDLWKLDGQ